MMVVFRETLDHIVGWSLNPCPNTKLLILQLPSIFIPGFYVTKVNLKFISKFSKFGKIFEFASPDTMV